MKSARDEEEKFVKVKKVDKLDRRFLFLPFKNGIRKEKILALCKNDKQLKN